MSIARALPLLLLLAPSLLACGQHPTPTDHRAQEPVCPMNTVNVYACTQDSDCTAVQMGSVCQAGFCNFNQCTRDADCAASEVCTCRGETGGRTTTGGYRQCLKGNCRVDSDCGAGGYCSPSGSVSCGSSFGVTGYFCHTSNDDCTVDSECDSLGRSGSCVYDPAVGHWTCGYGHCAG